MVDNLSLMTASDNGNQQPNAQCGRCGRISAPSGSADQLNLDIQIESCPRSIRGDDPGLLAHRKSHARAITERQALLPCRRPQEAGSDRQCRIERANFETEGEKRGAGLLSTRPQIDKSRDNLGGIDRGNDPIAQVSPRNLGALFLERDREQRGAVEDSAHSSPHMARLSARN